MFVYRGVYCSKDASVDYGSLTKSLLHDCKSFGCSILLGHKVRKVSTSVDRGGLAIIVADDREEKRITTEFVVNASWRECSRYRTFYASSKRVYRSAF